MGRLSLIEKLETLAPSYLLQLDGEAKEKQERLFRADLAAVAERRTELGG